MRRVVPVSGRGPPSMDGQRVRQADASRSLGNTVTYAPHRNAPVRQAPSHEDGTDPALRWRALLWIAGGIVVSAALVVFGVWAVVTTPPPAAIPAGPVFGMSPAGGFGFDVTGLRCGVSSIGPGGLEQRPGGQFCLLDLKVTNKGREPELFDSDVLRIHDADGEAYAVAEQAAVFLNDRSPSVLDEIGPGGTVAGVFPFDVPADARLTEVTLHGTLSTPAVRLSLPDPR